MLVQPTTTLSAGINGSQTTGIILVNAALFPTAGTNFVKIGREEISYTGISASKELTGVTREVKEQQLQHIVLVQQLQIHLIM